MPEPGRAAHVRLIALTTAAGAATCRDFVLCLGPDGHWRATFGPPGSPDLCDLDRDAAHVLAALAGLDDAADPLAAFPEPDPEGAPPA